MADLSFGIPLSDVVHDHERLFIEDYMRKNLKNELPNVLLGLLLKMRIFGIN